MARSTPTFRSLTAPLLTGGGERTPMVLNNGLAAVLFITAYYTWNLIALAACLAVFLGGTAFLRRMANRDPMMVAVSTRFIAYRKYYPARTPVRPWRG
jgi:type IV secretory pathway TrbD component